MSRLWTSGVTALLLMACPSVVMAQEAVLAYQRAVAHVCQKKVTPEMIRLEALSRSV